MGGGGGGGLSVADPILQIGSGERSSRPWDEMGTRSQFLFFGPSGLNFA